jgi:thiol-disulfide isomerase/thioredoxin
MSKFAIAVVVGLAAGIAGYFVAQAVGKSSIAESGVPSVAGKLPDATADVPDRRPGFILPDMDGKPRNVKEWDGKVLVVNFWATWCAPCLEEIPVFIALQKQHGAKGLQFVGIGIDDLENIKQFAAKTGMNYPVLHGQLAAINVGKAFGNRVGALPFTAVVDRTGRIVSAKFGAYTRETAEQAVLPLL